MFPLNIKTKKLIYDMIMEIDDKKVVPYPYRAEKYQDEFTEGQAEQFYQDFFDKYIKPMMKLWLKGKYPILDSLYADDGLDAVSCIDYLMNKE
jgi:hypothetical protein